MKTIQQLLEFLESEKNEALLSWRQAKDIAGINSCGACSEMGRVDMINDIIEFLNEVER